MQQCMLTTFDNPYDPFEQFTPWFLFDVEKGYNSCAYLGRIARTSDQLSDEIIRYDFRNIYKKLKKDISISNSKAS